MLYLARTSTGRHRPIRVTPTTRDAVVGLMLERAR